MPRHSSYKTKRPTKHGKNGKSRKSTKRKRKESKVTRKRKESRKRYKNLAGGGDYECAHMNNEYDCNECVDEWYFSFTDNIKDAIDMAISEINMDNIEIAASKLETTILENIKDEIKKDNESDTTAFNILEREFNESKDKRNADMVDQIKYKIKKDLLKKIVKIKTNPDFIHSLHQKRLGCSKISELKGSKIDERRKRH